MLALLPIVAGLVNGASLGTVLSGLSLGQWIAVAEAAASAEPEVVQDLSDLHPALAMLVDKVASGVGSEVAAQATKDWLAGNGQAAIDVQDELGK